MLASLGGFSTALGVYGSSLGSMASSSMPDIGDPKTIREASFSTSFRGFDQLEVRAFLQTLARQLGGIDELRAEAEAKVAAAERELEAAKDIDENLLTSRLGEDAARILQTARDTAAERLASAEAEAADLRARADADAAAIRQAAEDAASSMSESLAERERELDDAIENEQRLRDQHRQEALAQADRDAEDVVSAARSAGDQVLAEARDEGRAMVAEAHLVRERILSDLSRRRTNAKVQLEQLRAGRQRLIEAIEFASTAVADVNRELENSLPEARQAAETAGLTVPAPASVAEIESEIESARLVGHPFATSEEVELATASLESATDTVTDNDVVSVDVAVENLDEDAAGVDEEGAVEQQSSEPASATQEYFRTSTPYTADATRAAVYDVEAELDDGAMFGDAEQPDDFDSPGLVLSELGDDRNTLFRRKKQLPAVAGQLPRDEVPTVEKPEDFEQVRALDPTIELAPVVAAGVEPEREPEVAPEPAVEVEPLAKVEVEVESEAEVEPEVEVEAAPETKTETDSTAAGEPLVEASDDVVEEAAVEQAAVDEDVVEEVAVEEAAVEEAAVDEVVVDDTFEDDSSVDDLFDRLRADRELRVAEASALLATVDDVREPVVEELVVEPAAILDDSASATGTDTLIRNETLETTETLEIAETVETPETLEIAAESDAEGHASERLQQAEEALVVRSEALAELERTVGRKLKRQLAEEQNELLDLVRRDGDAPTIELVVGDIATHSKSYVDAVTADLHRAATAGATSVGAEAANLDISLATAQVRDELLSSMRLLVDRAIAGADDADDAIDHLRSLYREIKGQRLNTLAAGLVVTAYNAGVHAGLAAERVIRWELAPDSDCGSACSENLVAGVRTAGTPFPSGHLHPPASASCRCLLVVEQ